MARKRKPVTCRREAITPETVLRVAIYTRRSTDDEHQPYTIEAQTVRLGAYVDSQPGWQITARFTDDASGATLERPGLEQALAAARAGEFDLLLVYRLDRFSRRIRDLALLMDELDNAGVHLRSATEPFDTSSPAGRLFVQMLGAFAEFEREVIIDRVINGMERKAAKGEWTHGPRPYGYLVDPKSHRLVPHPDEKHLVREIFTLYAGTRLGTRAIAARLNEEGKRTRQGRLWSGHAVGRILGNRLYRGEVVFRDVTAEQAHPALVEAELFDQCQAILDARGEAGSQRAASNSDYQLTGRITCPKCGCKYVGTSATGKLRRYRYYTCFTRARYGVAACNAPRIDADLLDQAIIEALIDFHGNTDLILAAIGREQAMRDEGSEQERAQLAGIGQEIRNVEASIDRYLNAFENGSLDERDCGRRVQELAVKLGQLKVRQEELRQAGSDVPRVPSVKAIERLRRDLVEVLKQGTAGQRKAVIESHVHEIKIDGQTLIPIYKIYVDEKEEPEDDSSFRTMVRVVGRQGLEP
ncbi:MAG TPA: recombinase family protein [Candidatus Limnocylindrales bacterium]|nr:recombinase family protein [Candidatus Limnocylindrales bacterium]